MDTTETLRKVKEEVLNLTASPLYTFRVENGYFPVIGEGSHNAELMFVGEAPGKNEAKCGRPFCGAAGTILDQLLASIDIDRSDVYITNIVKDRPPQNRDPLPEEIRLYSPFLDTQIDTIQPKIIATLGRFSMRYILDTFSADPNNEPISTAHGKIFHAQASYGPILIMPQYHPAAAIYNRELISALEKDFQVIKDQLNKLGTH